MLLRLAYLGVTSALTLLRLLPMSDSAKDAEILALRHQITVLERPDHSPARGDLPPQVCRAASHTLVLRLARENNGWGYRRRGCHQRW